MKIDIEGIRQKKQEKEQQSKKEFEELKRKMDAAKLVEAVKPSPLIERSVKFSGGPKVLQMDVDKVKKQDAMKCEDQNNDVEEEVVEEPRDETIEDHYEDIKDQKP